MKCAKQIVACAIFIVAFFISNCTNMGGGSGTGNANTIDGILVKPDGVTPAKCNVYLYRSDRIPVIAAGVDTNIISHDSTNEEGRYVFRKVPNGRYNIYCADTIESFSKLLFDAVVNGNDSLYTGIDTLRVNREFSGRVSNAQGIQTIAFIYGSPFITTINSASGFFNLNNLPSGDTIIVTFKAMEQINGKNCQAQYTFTQLPDTTIYVTISLECN